MSQREQWQLTGDAAELYERYPVRYILGPWASALVARAGLKHGESVLDVACGTGVIARLAAPAVGLTGRVTGLDLNAGMVAVARSLPPPPGAPITWIEGSAMAMKLPNASFDVVFCQQGLQFFPDRLAALCEMRRVLKSSGRALLSVWRGMGLYHTAVTGALRAHVGAEVAARFSASRVVPADDELRRLAVDAGFRDVALEACRMNMRLPALDRFVLSHLAATPVAGAVAAASVAARAAVADEVRLALRAYAEGDGVTVPDESNVVTALA
ncbi:MAG TPA: methyltransferase domain-containing protein [Methylomirabilota bacterium]|jgi:SAM-dependent methyltransferase